MSLAAGIVADGQAGSGKLRMELMETMGLRVDQGRLVVIVVGTAANNQGVVLDMVSQEVQDELGVGL